MRIINNIKELGKWRQSVNKVAFVPTMGNLHQGHFNLVKEAKKYADEIVVSIFVNPLQFGEGEDFQTYPRTLKEDSKELEKLGVSVIFAPNDKEMYPNGKQEFYIEPPAIQNELCGFFRPGHFRGVATVVMKLFNIVQPDFACFGKKDFQQLHIIKAMISDFNIPIEIIPVDIERDIDGLALSSRNKYLTEIERNQATDLYHSILGIKEYITKGDRNFDSIINKIKIKLIKKSWNVDYIEVRDSKTLEIADEKTENLVILIAARLGSTRLIDNMEVIL